ncbi:methyl-accepting chemotaxis protein [Rubeoparvulum massiliense]|uniref:methyl-accepting chemotaxis protein n=1 Tax=Rubeoparvulum massiliense TaxID=1631346 RepID=UPI00065E6B86|nr:methyl-accepting chemotaxis protein [Rubeoparvulum massiliense]
MKNYSIRMKLLTMLVALPVVIIIALAGLIIPFTSQTMNETVAEQSLSNAQSVMKNLEEYVDGTLVGLSVANRSLRSLEEVDKIRNFMMEMAQDKRFREMVYYDLEGNEVARTGVGLSYSGKPTEQPIFQDTLIHKASISNPQPHPRFDGVFYIDIAILVDDYIQRPRGVLIARVNLKQVWGEIRGDVLEQGDSITTMLLLNQEGQVAAHDNAEVVMAQWLDENGEKRTISDLHPSPLLQHEAIKTVQALQQDEGSYQHVGVYENGAGSEDVVAMVTHPAYGFTLMAFTPVKKALAQLDQLKIFMALALLIATVITIILGVIFSQRLVQPIHQLMQTVQLVASGDLTQQVGMNRKDEIGQLSQHIDQMVSSLNTIANNVTESADETATTTKQLTHISHEVAESSRQVATTIEEIAKGAEEQAQLSQQTDDRVAEMVEMTVEVQQKTSAVSEEAEATRQIISESEQAISSLVLSIQNIAQSTLQSASMVKELQEHTAEISTIVEASNEIAKRTNLLALNAAIEANRAGEYGKGFLVVAHEIRQLAEQSGESSKQIAHIVQSVGQAIDSVVKQMEDNIQTATIENEQALEKSAALQGVRTAMDKVITSVSQIESIVEKQNRMSEEIAETSRKSSTVATEISAGAEEVAASSEEASAMMQEVAGNIQELVHQAEHLKALVQQFKVN